MRDFKSAFFGALIVSIVSTLLSWLVPGNKKQKARLDEGKVTDVSPS